MYFIKRRGWPNNRAASWSSGRVQDSGLGSRSSPGFNTLPMRLLVVPLKQGTSRCIASLDPGANGEGRFLSRGAKLRVSGCILPRELRWKFRWIYGLYRPNDQGRYLSKSAAQSSEPGCGLKTVTLPLPLICRKFMNWWSPYNLKSYMYLYSGLSGEANLTVVITWNPSGYVR